MSISRGCSAIGVSRSGYHKWIRHEIYYSDPEEMKLKNEIHAGLPLTNFKVRQVIFKDHGRQVPAFLVTNNRNAKLETLALHYADCWLIEKNS